LGMFSESFKIKNSHKCILRLVKIGLGVFSLFTQIKRSSSETFNEPVIGNVFRIFGSKNIVKYILRLVNIGIGVIL